MSTSTTTPVESNTTASDTTAERSQQPPKKTVDLVGLGPVRDALLAVQEEEKRLTRLREELEKIFKSRMGDAEIGLVDGQPAVTYLTSERTILRTKLIRDRHPKVARECEDTILVRTFQLVKP